MFAESEADRQLDPVIYSHRKKMSNGDHTPLVRWEIGSRGPSVPDGSACRGRNWRIDNRDWSGGSLGSECTQSAIHHALPSECMDS
jgi:hypothetical protein